jgi:hypothetical protein
MSTHVRWLTISQFLATRIGQGFDKNMYVKRLDLTILAVRLLLHRHPYTYMSLLPHALSLVIKPEPVLNEYYSFFEDSFRSRNRLPAMFLLLLEDVGVLI